MQTIMISEINEEYTLDLGKYSEGDNIILGNTEFEVIKINGQKATLKVIKI